MEENQKINFFRRVLISIKDFDKYKIFAQEKVSEAFKYIVKFLLLIVLVISISFAIKYGILFNSILNYIENDLPEFSYNDGVLEFDQNEPIIVGNEDSYKNISCQVIIDTGDLTEEKINEYKEKTGLYNYGILILKDRVILNSSNVTQTVEQAYSSFQEKYGLTKSFNKNDFIKYMKSKKAFTIYFEVFVLLYVYLLLSYCTSVILDAILVAVLGYLTSKIVRVGIKFSSCYAMSLYALTLSIILNMIYIVVNMHTGFYIKYFDLMYTAISYIYIIAAILSIRQDLIKEQVEVSRIVGEQNKLEENEIDVNDDGEKQNEEKKDEPSDDNIKLEDKSNDNLESNDTADGEA